jgi:acetyl-CoA carboxylase biotin carboxyl carrier protein
MNQEVSVADEASNSPSPFDVRTIRYLITLMSRYDLSEIDLREGDLRIRLRRGPRGIPLQPGPVVTGAGAAPPPVPSAAPPAPPPEADKPAKPLLTIKSPTPGTFYSAPSPDAPPFVRVGSRVTPTTVVCVIEAMKIFNQIEAECTGVITEILVENQQPVEYGQVLFKVDPTA